VLFVSSVSKSMKFLDFMRVPVSLAYM
jgi:hypothetical protein